MLLGQIAESLDRDEEALTWYRSVPAANSAGRRGIRSDYVLHELKRGARPTPTCARCRPTPPPTTMRAAAPTSPRRN